MTSDKHDIISNLPFDLDNLTDQLEAFREQCIELANVCVCVCLAKILGVPESFIYQYTPPEIHVEWVILPEVDDGCVRFEADYWSFGDREYCYFIIDRKVLTGEIAPNEWAKAIQAKYYEEQTAQEHQKNLDLAEERNERLALLNKLKEEFGDTE